MVADHMLPALLSGASGLQTPDDLVAYKGEANPRAGPAPAATAAARSERPAGHGGRHGRVGHRAYRPADHSR